MHFPGGGFFREKEKFMSGRKPKPTDVKKYIFES